MLPSLPSLAQGLLLSALAAGAYVATYRVNELFDGWAMYTQGINLVFLPAGVKHLAILLAGPWGALGCWLSLLSLATEFWQDISLPQVVLYSLISTASTWLGILLSLRVLGIESGLGNLRFLHLPAMDVITTAIHGFTTNAFFIAAGMKSEDFFGNALAMMFGDYVGSFLILTLLWMVLSALKSRKNKPSALD